MINIENLSRRGFLKGLAGTSAFVLGVSLMPKKLLAAGGDVASINPAGPMKKAPLQPGVYLAIDTDGTVYVIAHRSEMGNGVRTSLPRIVADELDADWARVKVVQATGDEKYGDQDTDGSHSVVSFFIPLREAGAAARLMLVRAAAQQWNVPAAECSTELHAVVHKSSGKKLGYGEVAEAASKLEVPKKEELKLKPRSEWRYIGKDAASYDLKDLCTGKGVYGQDLRMDGMLYASVMHPPVLGSSPKSIDNKATLAVAGVKQTETIDTFKPPVVYQALGGVAVLADNTWSAMQGKKKLKVEWETSSHGAYNSDAYKQRIAGDGAQAGKGGARSRQRRRGVCEGWESGGSGILRATAGARFDGTAGGAGGVSRRQGRSVGADAESSGRARCDCRSGRGEKGRRNRERHACWAGRSAGSHFRISRWKRRCWRRKPENR